MRVKCLAQEHSKAPQPGLVESQIQYIMLPLITLKLLTLAFD